jgi:5-bromo-4-chloroindolyl phosphate hydrolysis protein
MEPEYRKISRNKIMADWEKDIGVLKTDVKYIREDIGVMQKQIRDLNKTSHMGVGGIKVFLIIGGILGAIWTFVKLTD